MTTLNNNKASSKVTNTIPAMTPPAKPVAMTLEEQINALKAENQALKNKASAHKEQGLSFRVSTKGALSVYGMGRFPVTLYITQWRKLLSVAAQIEKFIEDNKPKFKVKSEGDAE